MKKQVTLFGNQTETEIEAVVWEKYGKRRVYFNKAGKKFAAYDLDNKVWIENYRNQQTLEAAFADILEIQSEETADESPIYWVATREEAKASAAKELENAAKELGINASADEIANINAQIPEIFALGIFQIS